MAYSLWTKLLTHAKDLMKFFFLILLLSAKHVHTHKRANFIVNKINFVFIANDIIVLLAGRLITLPIKTHKENCLPNTRANAKEGKSSRGFSLWTCFIQYFMIKKFLSAFSHFDISTTR